MKRFFNKNSLELSLVEGPWMRLGDYPSFGFTFLRVLKDPCSNESDISNRSFFGICIDFATKEIVYFDLFFINVVESLD